MIPFLPELPAPSGLIASGGAAMPPASPQPGTGRDFAGLLDAALPSARATPDQSAAIAPAASPVAGEAPAPADLPAAASPALPPPAGAMPGGKTLPEPAMPTGAQLPVAIIPAATELPPTPPELAAILAPAPIPTRHTAPRDMAVIDAIGQAEGLPPMPMAEIAPAPDAQSALETPADKTAQADPQSIVPDASTTAVAALPSPVALAAAAEAHLAENPVRSLAMPVLRAAAAPPALAEKAPLPARASKEAKAAPAEAAPAPAPMSAPSPAPAAVLSEVEAAAPSAPAPTLVAAQSPAPAPQAAMAERPAEPRAPAPQIESTIAQVGTMREALRTAQPEMTLRHAEFGAVSVRLEATGAEGWRAVLASRDPGFVPAIHAALADRAVAAAAASPDSGQNAAGHNGTSEQRYGSSPNGGQGGSQPYLGQSGSRDGGAAPDQRRPSTAATLAARAGQDDEVSAAPATRSGGVFA